MKTEDQLILFQKTHCSTTIPIDLIRQLQKLQCSTQIENSYNSYGLYMIVYFHVSNMHAICMIIIMCVEFSIEQLLNTKRVQFDCHNHLINQILILSRSEKYHPLLFRDKRALKSISKHNLHLEILNRKKKQKENFQIDAHLFSSR